MTTELSKFLKEVRERVEKAPMTINPYVTDKGGVVILNGPFKIKDAMAVAQLLKYARTDLTRLLALAEAGRDMAQALNRANQKLEVYFQQTHGEYAGGENKQEVRKAIEAALTRYTAAVKETTKEER